MTKKQRSFDWEALKIEWLSSNLNLNQFRESKKIDKAHFYKSIDIEKWQEARQTIYNQALKKLQNKKSTAIANRYDDYLKLWGAVKIQAVRILKDSQTASKPMRPGQLAQLAQAIETALKSEKLILGEATENVAHNVNLRDAIIGHIKKTGADPNVINIDEVEAYEKSVTGEQVLPAEQPVPDKNEKSGNFDFQIKPSAGQDS